MQGRGGVFKGALLYLIVPFTLFVVPFTYLSLPLTGFGRLAVSGGIVLSVLINSIGMKQLTIISFVLVILLSSCFGVHSGSFQSSAQLSAANYKVVKRGAQGKATTTVILFMGGLGKEALVAEAKESLMRQYNVTDAQLLANVSVDWRTITTPLYFSMWRRECTVTADIIEFVK
jgi:hypothetical protein